MTAQVKKPISCTNCPSFTDAKTAAAMKLSTGAPMCSRLGKVLGNPAHDNKRQEITRQAIASTCDEYGKSRGMGVIPGREQTEVMLGDPDLLFADAMSATDWRFEGCSSCAMCKNHVPSDVVQRELGWTSGLCSVKGKLILSSAVKQNAKSCDYREIGPSRRDVSSLSLLPVFEDAFSLATDPIKVFFQKQRDGLVNPQDYPSDREVTDEEAEHGIRAFRKVLDPEGSGNEVFLPIFDPKFFSDEDRAKIPMSGDDEHPELYIDHGGLVYKATVLMCELDETPALWGEPGSGKTEFARHMAWLMSLPFERISITGSSELDDLAGKSAYTPERGTFFQDGRIVKAWSRPCVMVVDEPNTGPPDVWQFLRPLTDKSRQLVLDQDQGQIIKRNDDCYLMLAMNPDWDPRNRGAEPIADADGSRLMHVWVPLPPPELEREIVKARVKLDGWEIDKARLDMLMSIATEIRALSDSGEIPVSWGIRSQIKVARALRFFDPVTAYRLGSADYLEPSAQQIMLDVVKANLA